MSLKPVPTEAVIRVLPEHMANLIAAGEVVERPASVIKELVENALDAGATNIEVEVNDSGFSLLRVTDDGSGMSPADARLAFQRHATSKLASEDDLNRIVTFGFRGEALPSIASVSRVEMSTRRRDQDAGVRLDIEGGLVKDENAIGCPVGTSFVVRDLFFNTPARRKFMKSPATERSHVVQIVEWMALANLHARFRMILDGKEVLNCPATTDLFERVLAVFGKQYPSEVIPVTREAGGVWVKGLLTSPASSRPTRQGMLFFINGRPIEHRGLTHAVLEAYRPYLAQGRFPYCLLFLDIPPEWVDVNVHPAKREVRLRDEHAIHDLVMRTVKDHLGTLLSQGGRPTQDESSGEQGPSEDDRGGNQPARTYSLPHASGWSGTHVRESVAKYFRHPGEAPPSLPLGFSARHSAPPAQAVDPGAATTRLTNTWPEGILGQAGRTYLVGTDELGFYLIDQHAAHERILYESFKRAGESLERQALLLPVTVDLSPARAALLQGNLDAFAAVGFEIVPFGKHTYAVQTQPRLWKVGSLDVWLNEVLDWMSENEKTPTQEAFRDFAWQRMACQAAVKAGDRLQPEVVHMIVEGLRELEPPLTCPHGRPLVVRWNWTELDRLFKRT